MWFVSDDSKVIVVRPLHLIPHHPLLSIGVAGIVVPDIATGNDTNQSIYFIDEGGYIVGGSNREEFFGNLHPMLFTSFVEGGLFVRHVIEGYDKKTCANQTTGSASSSGSVISVRVLYMTLNFVNFCRV